MSNYTEKDWENLFEDVNHMNTTHLLSEKDLCENALLQINTRVSPELSIYWHKRLTKINKLLKT